MRFPCIKGVIVAVAVIGAAPSMAVEYQCRQGPSAVRLAVEVERQGTTLPCEVVVEDDRGERVVLYRAQFDRDYCPSRIEQRRTALEADGWACRKTSETNIIQGTGRLQPIGEGRSPEAGAAGSPVAQIVFADSKQDVDLLVSDSRQCRRGGDFRRIRIEVENPAEGKPCDVVYWSEDDRSKDGQLLWHAEHDAAFCPSRLRLILDKWAGEGWRCDDTDAAEAIAPPSAAPPSVQAIAAVEPANLDDGAKDQAHPSPERELRAIVAADAKRIGEWMEVEPAFEIAAQGDLNADGHDDAVVFLAYRSEQAAYRQYLMSYLLADRTYELASVKLLTGVSPPPDQARIDQIDKGVIWLTVPGVDGGAPQATGYVLRGQQLVEVDGDAPDLSEAN